MDMEKAPSCCIDEVLGDPNEKKQEKPKSKHMQICNNEDKISNSSSPIENEKLLRREQQNQNKGKIELEFEITEEQKK